MTRKTPVFVPAGDTIASARPGDFILTRSDRLVSKLIRCGASRRYKGEQSVFNRYNHAALIVDDTHVVEALSNGGVSKNLLSKYDGREYTLVRADPIGVAPDSQAAAVMRKNAVDFALSCIGRPYGFTTNACIAIGLITGGSFTFGFDGQSICSGLVARSLERMGYNFGERNPTEIMPADLAYFFQVGAVDTTENGVHSPMVVQLHPGRALHTPKTMPLAPPSNKVSGKSPKPTRL